MIPVKGDVVMSLLPELVLHLACIVLTDVSTADGVTQVLSLSTSKSCTNISDLGANSYHSCYSHMKVIHKRL